MKFGDYSPPSWPASDQQRDALQKGLGRAWQWAVNRRLKDEPLLEACLRDQRFDTQCEDSRGNWLWRMVGVVGAMPRFRVPILHALHELSDERTAHQLCELAGLYAATGDEAFRTRLYEIVEGRPFADEPTLGETEILALDGEPAFVFAARVRGQALLSREWEWDDGSLVDSAISQCGEPELRNLLEASPDAAVRRFRDAWVAHRQKSAEKTQIQSHRESMRAVPVEEIFRAAEGDTKCYWFRGWGMHASEPELQAVLQRLWTVREPLVIWNLISVFAARALPEFDARFIEFCRHDDGEIRHKAFHALRKNADPRVRALALAELQEGLRDGYVAGLFINNYQQGDERLILDALELPEDACELHWLLTAVNDVLENNTEADCSQLGVIVYALTPCENCRFHAARRLHQQQRTPAWLREECQFDSAEECRKLVNQLADTTEPL